MNEKDFKHGDKVTCKIKGDYIADGAISIGINGNMYICQNEKDGSHCKDKLGYQCSWIIYSPIRTIGGKIVSFEDQLAYADACVTELTNVSIKKTLSKKDTSKTKEVKKEKPKKETFVEPDIDWFPTKSTEDLPVFSSDLDSTSKDFIKKGITRI